MAKKKFTEEEMNHLRASNYVLDVSPTIVHFSVQCICQLKNGPRSNSKRVHYSLVFNQEIVSSNL